MLNKWVIPTVTGLIGIVLGVVFQDVILPKFLHASISNANVDIYLRKNEKNIIDVLIANNSDETLDVSEIKIALIPEEIKKLSSYLTHSKLFLVNGKIENRFSMTSDEQSMAFVGTVKAQNTIPSGSRELLGIKFVSPALFEATSVELRLQTPTGLTLFSDGTF